ncbi:MAG TPA: type II toxin-antitoxin system VapC family toxin [Chthoniobacterales bacterium]|nr:type II toxin-antitoxin system VapC family toxin [Chthoniobacterales bacterium]
MADTTVLIDLWRYRKTPRRLADLTKKVGDAAILVPWVTQAEFSRGALFQGVSLEALAEFYEGFHLLALDQATMDAYCRLWVAMAKRGRAPDYPDLWIAACAEARKVPVLTRNPRHFPNVPDLDVIGYSIG